VLRVTTWNLQGREHPDLAVVAEVLAEHGSDVVLLQEVQHRQAKSLAQHLGWTGVTWKLKHWPLVIPAEGLAVLTREPVDHATVRVLARRWTFWSSHRRIALAVDVPIRQPADADRLRVVDTHLGAGVGDTERMRQATLVAALAADRPRSVIGGDLNTAPGSEVLRTLGTAGHRDAWDSHRGTEPGPTNWRPGPRDAAPVQRLDYLFVGPGVELVDVTVPEHGTAGFGRFGPLSDHLPVTATVRP